MDVVSSDERWSECRESSLESWDAGCLDKGRFARRKECALPEEAESGLRGFNRVGVVRGARMWSGRE
jgi:hypothetical protein